MQLQYSFPIYFEQLLTVIEQCNMEEKLRLFNILEKETARVRLVQNIDNIAARNINNHVISEEEIIAEVNEVRQQRYEQDKGSH